MTYLEQLVKHGDARIHFKAPTVGVLYSALQTLVGEQDDLRLDRVVILLTAQDYLTLLRYDRYIMESIVPVCDDNLIREGLVATLGGDFGTRIVSDFGFGTPVLSGSCVVYAPSVEPPQRPLTVDIVAALNKTASEYGFHLDPFIGATDRSRLIFILQPGPRP